MYYRTRNFSFSQRSHYEIPLLGYRLSLPASQKMMLFNFFSLFMIVIEHVVSRGIFLFPSSYPSEFLQSCGPIAFFKCPFSQAFYRIRKIWKYRYQVLKTSIISNILIYSQGSKQQSFICLQNFCFGRLMWDYQIKNFETL